MVSDDLMNVFRDDGYVEVFIEMFGVEFVSFVDKLSYEGVEYVYDLNFLIVEDWKGNYFVVIDLGFVEYVFNFL